MTFTVWWWRLESGCCASLPRNCRRFATPNQPIDLVCAPANRLADPRDDRGPAKFFKDFDAYESVALPDHFAGRDVEPLHEDGDVAAAGRQPVAFQLEALGGDIADR